MIEHEFDVGRGAGIDVHIHSGRVEVSTGSDRTISVEVDTDDPGFVVEQRGDLVYVFSDNKTRWSTRGHSNVVIEVPEGADVTIGAASAKIECSGPLGRVEAKTASGEIEIGQAESATIKTASGDASVGTVTGDIKINSASGDARVGECPGKASFAAASGDIHMDVSTGTVNASTASGDITIERFTGRRAVFKSMSGTAIIGVPTGTRLDLDATLLSGKLKLPQPVSDSPPSERQMTIKAKLVSGDLTIRRI
ncbi:MAG: DUF4097 family beta strand repeat-containing protein [Acidimicrobiia bacterium]